MAEKQKLNKKQRDHKESKGSARGARRTRLTDVQKVLICGGGIAHKRLRQRGTFSGIPKKSSQ